MKKDVWNKDVAVEKSAYLMEHEIKVFNEENFKFDKNKPTMIDLFSGAGGFSVGCNWAGFQSVLATDWLEPALKTWQYNHPNGISILGDIRNLETEYVKNLLSSNGVKSIDLITGGVPCQGFSLANRKHNDNDERNFLFIDFMRFVEAFSPKYIILENVSGMRSTAGGKFVDDILQYMDDLGYNATVEMLNAINYGVPQKRNRLIFVGVKKTLEHNEKFNYPKPTHLGNGTLLDDNLLPSRNVRDAISDLPLIYSHESSEEYTDNNLTEYQEIMKGIHPDYPFIPKPVKLSNHVAPSHPQATINKIGNTEPGKPMYERYKQRIRLNYNNPSPTQVAGGIRPQFQFGHPEVPRGLTVRERARIQSFPDSYVFLGGTVQERVQTGNAVPPLLIYNIAKVIYENLKKG